MIQISLNVGEETSFDGSGTQKVIINDTLFDRKTYTGQDSLSWVIYQNVGRVNAAIIYKDGVPEMAIATSPNILVNDDNTHTLTVHFVERHHQMLANI